MYLKLRFGEDSIPVSHPSLIRPHPGGKTYQRKTAHEW
jgi:hypothetical protein